MSRPWIANLPAKLTTHPFALRDSLPPSEAVRTVTVAGVGFVVPARATLRWSRNGSVCYALCPDGLRVISRHGELEVSDRLRAALLRHYFPDGAHK